MNMHIHIPPRDIYAFAPRAVKAWRDGLPALEAAGALAANDAASGVLTINGPITMHDGEDWLFRLGGGGCCGPKEVQEFLDTQDGEVVVKVHSPGGSVYGGEAIRQMLSEHAAQKGMVTCHVIGIAASAASYILMGASKVVIAKGAQIMVHRCASGGLNAEEHRTEATALDKFDGTLVDMYTEKVGEAKREEVKDAVWAETYLTAKESVELGLADEISDAVAKPKRDAAASIVPTAAYVRHLDTINLFAAMRGADPTGDTPE